MRWSYRIEFLGNEIYRAQVEAQTTLENKKLDAATKRNRISGIHSRLTQSLVFTLGVIMMEVPFSYFLTK
jgi:hypothetical protein